VVGPTDVAAGCRESYPPVPHRHHVEAAVLQGRPMEVLPRVAAVIDLVIKNEAQLDNNGKI
jgi:hypothetical protein